jgi:hypothetical protein
MTPTITARLGALLVVAAIIVACGPSTPSAAPSATTGPTPTVAPTPDPTATPDPSASQDPDAIWDAIEEQVLALRGLDRVDVEREAIDEDELVRIVTELFDTDYPESYVLATERLYKALGLMEEDASLRTLYLDLIGASVAGFYRPEVKKLYVVSRSGTIGAADKLTFAHEYTHALQDATFQYWDDADDLLDQTDQGLARAGLSEGDATFLMFQWAQAGNLSPAEITEYLESANDPEQTAILERTPAILTEPLLFPYTTGLQFLLAIQGEDGWPAVDAAYDRPPTTTEQVIHPEKYEAAEPAVEVEIPDDAAGRMGDGWSIAMEDTWGELQTRIWLTETGQGATADVAAAGWGGDRLAVLTGPDGAWAVVLDTRWDTTADEEEFLDAALAATATLEHPANVSSSGDGDVTVMIASDDAALVSLDRIFGDTGA